MEAAELKALIESELKRDQTLCKAAVIPALAESGVPCADVIGEYASLIGLDIAKTQTRWMDEYESGRSLRAERRKEDVAAFEALCAQWDKVYTVRDFPDWVVKFLEESNGDADLYMLKKARWIQKQKPETMTPNDIANQFCVKDDVAYFSEEGYRFIVRTSARKFLTEPEVRQWMEESGLYPARK